MDPSTNANSNPKIIGYFIFLILITLNLFLRFVSHKKFQTSSSYNRYTRQFTTWNAYITSFILILCGNVQSITKLQISIILFGFLTNWFVLTARWYWFKLPNHTLPLSWILSDLWFHLLIPIVYTFYAMYILQNSSIQQTISEYILAIVFFMGILSIWYTLNIGIMYYSPNQFPWPYCNGAGIDVKSSVKQVFKFALTFLNICIVLLFGWCFWKSVPRNYTLYTQGQDINLDPTNLQTYPF